MSCSPDRSRLPGSYSFATPALGTSSLRSVTARTLNNYRVRKGRGGRCFSGETGVQACPQAAYQDLTDDEKDEAGARTDDPRQKNRLSTPAEQRASVSRCRTQADSSLEPETQLPARDYGSQQALPLVQADLGIESTYIDESPTDRTWQRQTSSQTQLPSALKTCAGSMPFNHLQTHGHQSVLRAGRVGEGNNTAWQPARGSESAILPTQADCSCQTLAAPPMHQLVVADRGDQVEPEQPHTAIPLQCNCWTLQSTFHSTASILRRKAPASIDFCGPIGSAGQSSALRTGHMSHASLQPAGSVHMPMAGKRPVSSVWHPPAQDSPVSIKHHQSVLIEDASPHPMFMKEGYLPDGWWLATPPRRSPDLQGAETHSFSSHSPRPEAPDPSMLGMPQTLMAHRTGNQPLTQPDKPASSEMQATRAPSGALHQQQNVQQTSKGNTDDDADSPAARLQQGYHDTMGSYCQKPGDSMHLSDACMSAIQCALQPLADSPPADAPLPALPACAMADSDPWQGSAPPDNIPPTTCNQPFKAQPADGRTLGREAPICSDLRPSAAAFIPAGTYQLPDFFAAGNDVSTDLLEPLESPSKLASPPVSPLCLHEAFSLSSSTAQMHLTLLRPHEAGSCQ